MSQLWHKQTYILLLAKQAKENDGNVAHVGSGNYSSEEAKEIARLKRELKNKDDALQILKKAMGILAREER